jgi:hypothetical protein
MAGLVLEYWEGHEAWLGHFYAKFGFMLGRSARPHYRLVKRPRGERGENVAAGVASGKTPGRTPGR